MKKTFQLAALAIALLMATGASAVPIEFIYTGTGSGTLGQTIFGSSAFTITQFADTANLRNCSSFGATCVSIDASSATVNIAGLGMFDIFTGTRTFDNGTIVGFSRAVAAVGLDDGLDLYSFIGVPDAYNLSGSIGPLAGSGRLLQWLDDPLIETSGGTLIFNTGQPSGTFQAIAGVPVPASFALMGLGLAGLGWSRRKKA